MKNGNYRAGKEGSAETIPEAQDYIVCMWSASCTVPVQIRQKSAPEHLQVPSSFSEQTLRFLLPQMSQIYSQGRTLDIICLNCCKLHY